MSGRKATANGRKNASQVTSTKKSGKNVFDVPHNEAANDVGISVGFQTQGQLIARRVCSKGGDREQGMWHQQMQRGKEREKEAVVRTSGGNNRSHAAATTAAR